jgi:L-threonylcarbamoyladenylate synthase
MSAAMSAAVLRAAAVIRAGGLVGMPTETVYGLAANARDVQAVLAVFLAKGRPRFDPLIVHVADAEQAWTVAVPSPRARLLAERFWPGALSLVLPRRDGIPDAVTGGLETVAVRCPDHELARALIRAAGVPLAAPSANLFGRLSPTTAAAVHEQLGEAVAEVLDGGPCRVGIESTVLLVDPQPVILRLGGVTREELSAALGEPVALAGRSERAANLGLPSPGLLASHYAPRTPLMLRVPGAPWPAGDGHAILSWRGEDLPAQARRIEVLSRAGDLGEAAAGLFAALRRLDASGATAITAERVPEQGLGAAINDRLLRAAGLG